VTTISPTRQETHQKKWKMYIRKRLKKKPNKRWIWQHRMLWMWTLNALLAW
jgi:hypothetical protein